MVLRVPKVTVKTRQSTSSSQPWHGAEGRAEGSGAVGTGSGAPSRRSMSPAKRTTTSDAVNRTAEETDEDTTGGYEYATQSTSAAEWNSLLIWARRQRGPQWDAATGM